MKHYIIPLLGILFISTGSKRTEHIVEKYLIECNNYRVDNAALFLDTNYTEVFINGDLEIENLKQFKDFMAWRKIMNSKASLLSIKSANDTITTIESNFHIMDKILDKKPRTFKIHYIIKNKKILKSIIDTLPGYTETWRFNNKKYTEFRKYCKKEDLESDVIMTAKGALKLKQSLMQYDSFLKSQTKQH